MMTKQTLSDFLDSQDFFELMQTYRHTPLDGATEYDAVRFALIAAIAQPERPTEKMVTPYISQAQFDKAFPDAAVAQPEQPTAPTNAMFQQAKEITFGGRCEKHLSVKPCMKCAVEPTAQPVFLTNLDFALRDPIFNRCRAIMGTTNEFQDGALLNVLRYFLATALPVPPVKVEPAQPVPPFEDKRKAAMAVYSPPFKYLHGYIYDAQKLMVADNGGIDDAQSVEGAIAARVRGWGRLGYLPNGAELQDEIGQMMADALNTLYSALPASKVEPVQPESKA